MEVFSSLFGANVSWGEEEKVSEGGVGEEVCE